MIDMKIILDSGAFSSWTQGATIDIVDYMAFIEKNAQWIHRYINLDVIPGRPRQAVREHDKEMAARASWMNYQSMRRAGFDPIPVFHFGEDFRWLHKILDAQPSYMSLGGLVKQNPQALRWWLDRVFTVLCDGQTYPKIPVHGLGMTSLPLMIRYPWTSVDSVSWLLHSAFGFVYLADRGYDRPPQKIHVSQREAGKKISAAVKQGNSYDAMGPVGRAYLEKYVTDQGFDWAYTRESPYGRALLNYKYYDDLSAKHKAPPFRQADARLFSAPVATPTGKVTPPKFQVIYGVPGFIMTGRDGYTNALNLPGEGHRMLSYHYWSLERMSLPTYVSKSNELHEELQAHATTLRQAGKPYRHPDYAHVSQKRRPDRHLENSGAGDGR